MAAPLGLITVEVLSLLVSALKGRQAMSPGQRPGRRSRRVFMGSLSKGAFRENQPSLSKLLFPRISGLETREVAGLYRRRREFCDPVCGHLPGMA